RKRSRVTRYARIITRLEHDRNAKLGEREEATKRPRFQERAAGSKITSLGTSISRTANGQSRIRMNVAEILANAVKGVCPKPSRRIPEGPLSVRQLRLGDCSRPLVTPSTTCPPPGREAAVRPP